MIREYESGAGASKVLETGSTPVVASTFITPNGNQGGYGYGYNGNILEAVILASILGNGRLGYGADTSADSVLGQNVSNLRKDVADNAAETHKLGNEIQQAFAAQTASQAADFRNLDNQICMVEKAAIEAKYEAKIQTLESTNLITDKIDSTTGALKDQIYNLSTTIASEFCDVKHEMEKNKNELSIQMERSFNKLEENRLRDEIAALREQLDCQRRNQDAITNNLLMSQQTNSILNAIDSQLQRQTSQIVQFGTGNGAVSTPTSTNNSVS
jgi:hypothetical protein